MGIEHAEAHAALEAILDTIAHRRAGAMKALAAAVEDRPNLNDVPDDALVTLRTIETLDVARGMIRTIGLAPIAEAIRKAREGNGPTKHD